MAIETIDRDIGKFAKAIGADLGLATEKIAGDLHGKITKRTPVDSGRARASWDMGIGAPPEGVPPEGQETYQEPLFDGGQIDGLSEVFIVSNLVYMEPLENGHSQQAPNGMVALSIAEVVAEMDVILAEFDNNA